MYSMLVTDDVFASSIIYRIVPVNNATAGNKSKTEDTLNSNGILTEDAEEPSQFLQKSVTNASSQMQINSKSGSTADVSSGTKRTQVSYIDSAVVDIFDYLFGIDRRDIYRVQISVV